MWVKTGVAPVVRSFFSVLWHIQHVEPDASVRWGEAKVWRQERVRKYGGTHLAPGHLVWLQWPGHSVKLIVRKTQVWTEPQLQHQENHQRRHNRAQWRWVELNIKGVGSCFVTGLTFHTPCLHSHFDITQLSGSTCLGMTRWAGNNTDCDLCVLGVSICLSLQSYLHAFYHIVLIRAAPAIKEQHGFKGD